MSDSEAQELAVEITAELVADGEDFNEDVDQANHQIGLIKWLEGDEKVLEGVCLSNQSLGGTKWPSSG